MDKATKQSEIEGLKKTFAENETFIVTQNKGMTVAQVTELRRNLRKNGAAYKVSKNTLAKIALKGTKNEEISELLTGPTAITSTAGDGMVAIKTVYDFAKKYDGKITVVGGAFGDMKLDIATFEKLAKLPGLNELRGKLVGLIQAPAAQLARLADAYSKKEQA